jgi:hypothetical protein
MGERCISGTLDVAFWNGPTVLRLRRSVGPTPGIVPVAVLHTLPDSLPARSSCLPLSRLIRLPLPERLNRHLRQLQRAARPRRLRISPARSARSTATEGGSPSRSTSCSPADRPGLLGTHASHQAHHNVGPRQTGGTCIGAGRARVIEDDAAPPSDLFPTPWSMHRWFPP